MTKSKKTAPKTSTTSVTKKTAAKKTAPKKSEDVKLYQNFINGLKNLEIFWDKQVINLKKQLDALRAKPSSKQKVAKTTAGRQKAKATSQETLTELREQLATAKSSTSKYAALRKMVAQFERDWQKNENETKVKPATKSKKNTKKDAANIDAAPHSLKDKSAAIASLLMTEEDIDALNKPALEAEIGEDLEDIFMPQDDLSEFEVIEDFNTDVAADADDDNYDSYS